MFIVISLIILNFLIFIHELGHLLAAKIVKVHVEEFAIGMGLKLLSKTIGDTEYTLRLFPVGGFVRFNDDSYKEIHATKQSFIIVGGVIFNFLTAIVFSFIYLILVDGFSLSVFPNSFILCWDITKEVFVALTSIFSTFNSANFSGPVGVVNIINDYVSQGLLVSIQLIIILSINLGVFNLLPIPMVDGGQLVISLSKIITKKKEYPLLEKVLNYSGLAIIFVIFGFAIFNDIKMFFIK